MATSSERLFVALDLPAEARAALAAFRDRSDAALWRPVVLCAEVEDGAGALGALQGRLAAALADAGLHEPERRRYRPHATVARLRSGERAPRVAPEGPDPVRFAGEAVTLYRSHLGRGGARYEALERVPVG
jgi:RNA 2',3'-cyclic 3'-phosphodiesterase